MTKAIDIANYIIYKVNHDGKGITVNNLKLQKLLYYAEAQCLADENRELFEDDIEKWQLGPVIPDVYHSFKMHGANALKEPVDTVKQGENFWEMTFHKFREENILEKDKNIVNKVIEEYGDMDPFDLVNKTHREELWNKDENRIKNGVRHIVYDKNEIKEYFRNVKNR